MDLKNEQAAYEHYVALCISEGILPLTIDGWKTLCNGDIPEELTERRTKNIRERL